MVEETIEDLRAQLVRAREMLKQKTQIAVLKGAQAGDVVFLTPPKELSEAEQKSMREQLASFHGATGVRVVLLPPGFMVNAKSEETPTFDPSGQDGAETR